MHPPYPPHHHRFQPYLPFLRRLGAGMRGEEGGKDAAAVEREAGDPEGGC
jgi:hypothetical protein